MSQTEHSPGAAFADVSTAIPIRRPERPLSRDIPRHWYGGNAFASHVLDALSSTFPAGEAFFVRSVHHYRDRVEDPELAEQIHCFAGQEGQHRRVHADHVQLLLDQGYTWLATLNRFIDTTTRWLNRRLPSTSIAFTAAIEHLTAILARKVLANSAAMTRPMHPEMASLWRWHALEEAEHKSVAFDVLERYSPGHVRRVLALMTCTTLLCLEVTVRLIYMLGKDGVLLRRTTWSEGWRFLFGTGGLLRDSGRDYMAWYRRGFHPDQIDDAQMIATARPLVDAELAA